MSDLLTAASQALGVPEALVKRSAEARAKASGSSTDDVLEAWAGGGTVAPVAPETEAPPPQPDADREEIPEAPEPEPEPAASPGPPAPVEPAPVPAAAAVVVEEPVQAAPLRARVRVAGRVGALAGAVAGLFVVLAAAPWLLPRASLTGPEEALRPAVEVVPSWLILGYGGLSLGVGAAVGVLARSVTGWFGRGMRLVGSNTGTVAVGAVIGLLMGLLIGVVIAGGGEPSQLTEGVVIVPVVGSVVWSVAGWLVTGWMVGAAVEAVGVPAGIDPEDVEEVGEVRRRLVNAFAIPALAVAAIAVLVLPVGYMFINFPEWAPLLGVFVAGSILAFAGLSASRPHARLSAGDLFAALAGIGVVVVIIVAVLVAQGGGHGEEEGAVEEPPAAEALQVLQA